MCVRYILDYVCTSLIWVASVHRTDQTATNARTTLMYMPGLVAPAGKRNSVISTEHLLLDI